MSRGFFVVAALGLAAVGCGSRAPLEGPSPVARAGPSPATRFDLLAVVDNTSSMEPKQRLLANALVDLVSRLVNPACTDDAGNAVSAPDPDADCPAGAHREFAPVRDLHVGVITTSIGSHGGDACTPISPAYDPMMNDQAQLVGSLDRGAGVPTWRSSGFLAWGRDGEHDLGSLAGHVRGLMRAVGTRGCGFEAPLEAMYRFLVDPEPYASIPLEPCPGEPGADCAVPKGLDQALLYQRSAFLRPDSTLLVVVMSDENDCSFKEGQQNWVAASTGIAAGSATLPRGTSACAKNPDDRCCVSCTVTAPAGCPATVTDPACKKGVYNTDEDPANLRCWDDKRRFGYDFLYPVDRYAQALAGAQVPDRRGMLVDNPLFAGGRDASQVFVATLAGVPWQLVTRKGAPADRLEYKDARELAGAWDGIFADPHMVESITPRAGLPAPSATDLPDPIEGHEWNATNELQYACTFPLWDPIDCAPGERDCDCHSDNLGADRPICQPPAGGPPGTRQYAIQAYPGLRQLKLVQALGDQGIAASICARNVTDTSRQDFGYRPLVGAVLERIAKELR